MKPETADIREHWALDRTRQLDTCRDGCWHKHQACLLAMLCDRVDELEAALRQYADAANWGVVVYTDDVAHVRWIGPGDSGPDVAREALDQ